MTTEELLQLESLLVKWHSECDAPLGLSNIRPCLFMVQEKLTLINSIEGILYQEDCEDKQTNVS